MQAQFMKESNELDELSSGVGQLLMFRLGARTTVGCFLELDEMRLNPRQTRYRGNGKRSTQPCQMLDERGVHDK